MRVGAYMNISTIAEIVAVCKALSDPGRLEALLALDEREVCICDLADMLGLSGSTVSRHMAVLEQAGLVEMRKDGRWHYFRHAQVAVPGVPQYAVAWIRECVKRNVAKTRGVERSGAGTEHRDQKPNVLFLCSANSCRSQMAEAFLRKYGGEYFHVSSAGIEPRGVDPLTVKILEEIGMDVSQHRSKSVMEFIGRTYFDYLIIVCSKAEEICPIFPGVGFRLYWPFEDPRQCTGNLAVRTAKYREVRDAIEQKVKEWVDGYITGMQDHVRCATNREDSR